LFRKLFIFFLHGNVKELGQDRCCRRSYDMMTICIHKSIHDSRRPAKSSSFLLDSKVYLLTVLFALWKKDVYIDSKSEAERISDE